MFMTMVATDYFRNGISNENAGMIILPWIIAVTIASERVYLGCHRPHQVALGLAMGAAVSFAYYPMVRTLVI